jgi:hypothetical protein
MQLRYMKEQCFEVSQIWPAYPFGNSNMEQRRTQDFFFRGGFASGFLWGGGGGSTNSVEDTGQRERGSGGGDP